MPLQTYFWTAFGVGGVGGGVNKMTPVSSSPLPRGVGVVEENRAAGSTNVGRWGHFFWCRLKAILKGNVSAQGDHAHLKTVVFL